LRRATDNPRYLSVHEAKPRHVDAALGFDSALRRQLSELLTPVRPHYHSCGCYELGAIKDG